jgi:hypothetical protein
MGPPYYITNQNDKKAINMRGYCICTLVRPLNKPVKGAWSFRQPDISSNCHFVSLLFHHNCEGRREVSLAITKQGPTNGLVNQVTRSILFGISLKWQVDEMV